MSKTQKKESEWKSKYLRALADYQNLLKRFEQERVKIREEAMAEVLKPFLEVYEDIERAESFVEDEGLRLIKEKFEKVMRMFGVSEIELEGKDFDPEKAEVVDVQPAERKEEENKISKVYRKAYRLKDRILQVGKVQVKRRS